MTIHVEKVKAEILTPKFCDHFFATTWEKLLQSVVKSHIGEKLESQFNEFELKYLKLV